MQDLLGAPTYTAIISTFKNNDEIWDLLRSLNFQKVVAVTSWQTSNVVGLETNVHYTILEASEPAANKRLIKLRNPFLSILENTTNIDEDKPAVYKGPWNLWTDWK